jgi:hypothetical protein
MKTSVSTAVSFTAVLAAGGLAFAVNTRALSTTVAVESSVPTVAAIALPSDSTSTTMPMSGATSSPIQSTVSGSMVAESSEFELPGIGVITLQKNVDSLRVLNIKPVVGFTYSSSQQGSDQVRVELLSASQKVEFRARLLDNRIFTDVQAENISDRNQDNDDDDDDDDDNQKHQKDHERNEKNEGQDDDD